MKYSSLIDEFAKVIGRRVFKWGSCELDIADSHAPERNPLFYPCLIAFTLVGLCAAAPLDSALRHLTLSWLPSPIVSWGILLCIVYPIARFCTALLALRVR